MSEEPVVLPNGSLLRYSYHERMIHWVAAISYVYLMLTGLAFWSLAVLDRCGLGWRHGLARIASVGRSNLCPLNCADVPDVGGADEGDARGQSLVAGNNALYSQ